MTVKFDEQNDMVFLDQEEYWAMVNKYKELEMRIMKLEKDTEMLRKTLGSGDFSAG